MIITHSQNPGPQHGVPTAGATANGELPALHSAGCFIFACTLKATARVSVIGPNPWSAGISR
ncbi:hypothetical protein AOC05_15290 [Arthrobacter alpinus]|uniref:Uncharacterized protein n=1 Tax=Arthrobacter alpinus TaxID=656366 RepID=A0A0M3UGV0_9MICC|nr:hypothetical protein AOC05_15290 [Arthrobacter alpinus]